MAQVPSQILQLLPIPATVLFNALLSLFYNGKILPSRLLPICAGLAALIAETIQLINQLLRNFSGLIQQVNIGRVADRLLGNRRVNQQLPFVYSVLLQLEMENPFA